MVVLPASLEIAPFADPIEAVVRPPGSKSLTNRAMILAALADPAAGRIGGPLEADDTEAMRRCLRGLGVLIDDANDPWLILGTGGRFHPVTSGLDAGASGTTARFVTAVATLTTAPVVVDGTPRMRQRPIGDLVEPLTRLGADLSSSGGFPPVSIRPATLHGGEVSVSGAVSSQFLSALLMIGPVLPDPLVVTVAGGRPVSQSYVRSTVEAMRVFGGKVEELEGGYRVFPGGYRKTDYQVEADASALVYPAVAVAIRGGVVGIDGVPDGSLQPDLAILTALAEMGVGIRRHAGRVILEASGQDLSPIDIDMKDAPDASLALAVACLFATGPSRIRGLSTLRVKETDRLAALTTEIRRLGAGAEVEGDSLVVIPGKLKGTSIRTYDDHRMAMSFALVGLRVPGVVIEDPGCVTKTWPGFFQMLEALR